MNFEAVKAKLKAMEDGAPKSKRWKPKDEHTVRALPLIVGGKEEDLATMVKWHYGVDNGRQMYCPTTHGDECPFCELGQFLRSWKDENGKDKSESTRKKDWELFKKISAAEKFYVPIVVRKKDSADVEGPFLWEMTQRTYKELFKICANEDRNEEHPDGGGLRVLTSLMHGVDVTVTLKKKGEKGNTTSFDLTEVEPRLKPSPVFKGDEKAAKALLERIPPINDVAKPITTAEAQKIFASWEGSMSSGESDAGAGVEHGNGNAEKVATGGKGVDETVSALEALLAKKKD